MRIDVTGAEQAVALLADSGGALALEGVDTLLALPAYRAWTRVSGAGVGGPAVLRRVLGDRGVSRRDLADRLAVARHLPVAEAQAEALSRLPPGSSLNATVYVLADGSGGALAGDGGEIVLDLLGVPRSASFVPQTVLPVLAHEFHHVGYAGCRACDAAAVAALAVGGARAQAVRLLDDLLLEGTANAYFTPAVGPTRPVLGPALADLGIDPQVVAAYADQVAAARERLPELVSELDRHLRALFGAAPDRQALAYAAAVKSPRQGLPRPVAHFLGEAMVDAIRQGEGDAGVLAVIRDLAGFVPVYQRVAERGGLPRISAETAARLEDLWRATPT